jgi:hypothetical protein
MIVKMLAKMGGGARWSLSRAAPSSKPSSALMSCRCRRGGASESLRLLRGWMGRWIYQADASFGDRWRRSSIA